MELGVVGLSVMGGNLAKNAARNGAKVALYNRTTSRMTEFYEKYEKEGNFVPCKTLEELKGALHAPRAILVMVKAGKPVDMVIDSLLPILEKGDVIVDGGNSHWNDTERRHEELMSKHGIRFVGMGVSGGEEGALWGPSMMPGGDLESWHAVSPLLEKMAAADGIGGKCVTFCGLGAAGHFVKMVHNGIEYAIMQLIAETYDMLRKEPYSMSPPEIGAMFKEWNESESLKGFLVEITADILVTKDDKIDGKYLVDAVMDKGEQKGTGLWTSQAGLLFGVPLPAINAALTARVVSADTSLRKRGRSAFGDGSVGTMAMGSAVECASIAFERAMVLAYIQGFELLSAASKEKGWKLNFGEVARIWRGGCIIRSTFLSVLTEAYTGGNGNDWSTSEAIKGLFDADSVADWRGFVSNGIINGIALPCYAASLAYYDSIAAQKLPQNIIQAQRDSFGAHTYHRVDMEGVFHSHWA